MSMDRLRARRVDFSRCGPWMSSMISGVRVGRRSAYGNEPGLCRARRFMRRGGQTFSGDFAILSCFGARVAIVADLGVVGELHGGILELQTQVAVLDPVEEEVDAE